MGLDGILPVLRLARELGAASKTGAPTQSEKNQLSRVAWENDIDADLHWSRILREYEAASEKERIRERSKVDDRDS